MNKTLPEFATEAEAADFMYALVDDDCVDNYRFAFADDAEAMTKYDAAQDSGCCGSSDHKVSIAGRPAFIGCNYGH
jgi:hypothetical protein